MKVEQSSDARHPLDRPSALADYRASLARRCWQLALVLSLIGLILASLAIWGERRAAAAAIWRDPADDILPDAVAADLTLLSLAGASDDQILTLAIEAGELETVRVLLVFSPDLTDQRRMNGWLWLAQRYQQAARTQRAAQAYRLAGGGAILSGDLPDLLRTETLLTVGRQLIALHDASSARFYLQQAALVGAYAPHLRDHHRRSLLERLIPASLRAGGKRDDWSALASTVKSGAARGGSLAFGWQNATPGKDATLVAVRAARRTAAASLAENPAKDTARQALRQALLAEETATEAYLTQDASAAAQQTRLRWLLLKRCIAAGCAGPGLVPEWESDRDGIDAALNAAWANWLALYSDPTSGDPRQAARAARRAIVGAYWGLYPDAPISELVSMAQELNNPGQLHLAVIKTGTPPVVGWSE